MPYPGMSKSMQKKMEKCVAEVMKDGKPKENAIAICRTQLKASENVYGMIDLFKGSEGQPVSRVQLLIAAKFNTEKYGEFEVTTTHLEQMVANENIRKGIPIDIDHDGGEAAGWITNLAIENGNELWADVEWNDLGKDKLKNKRYRFMSPEFTFNYIDPEHGTFHGAVLIAGTLTNRPLFKRLQALTASEKLTDEEKEKYSKISLFLKADEEQKEGDPMLTLEEIREKDVADLTDEEKAFLNEHADELTDEDKEKFGDVLETESEESEDADSTDDESEESEESEDESDESDDTDDTEESDEADGSAEDSGDGEGGAEDAVKGKEATVTISAAELATLKAQAEENKKLKTETYVNKTFIASEKGGKVYPKARGPLVELVMSFNDKQKELFEKVMDAVAEIKLSEAGSSAAEIADPVAKIDQLVEEAMKADEKLSPGKALLNVSEAHPELFKRVEDQA